MTYERNNIHQMHGYSWGEQPIDGHTIKLNTNENPYPPSERVKEALGEFDAAQLRTYPNPLASNLRQILAQRHDVAPEQIVVTHGGDEALRLALTTFVDPGTGFGIASPSYSLYPVLSAIQDARLIEIALDENWLPAAGFTDQMNAAQARLVCLVNPHAPSGKLLSQEQLRGIARSLTGILLIDEAYVDFVDPESEYSSLPLLESLPNVLILRSFSKGYGLAGLRLGYLLGSRGLIDPILSKTRDSYNVDAISQVLGQAAFEDQAYAASTWKQVRKERLRMSKQLAQLGMSCCDSQANFLLATVSSTLPYSAAQLYAELKAKGILVRYFDQPRLDDKLRITIGTPEQNNQLLSQLADLL